jgi:hypothetical protein
MSGCDSFVFGYYSGYLFTCFSGILPLAISMFCKKAMKLPTIGEGHQGGKISRIFFLSFQNAIFSFLFAFTDFMQNKNREFEIPRGREKANKQMPE